MINEKLATPDLQDETTGDTAIHVCIECGNLKMMKALIASLAPTLPSDLSEPERLKQTNEGISKILTIQNKDGNTPLHLACAHNDVDSLKFLFQWCSCHVLFVRNEQGLWPLSSASLLVRGVVRSEFIAPRLAALSGGSDPAVVVIPRDPMSDDETTIKEEEGFFSEEKGDGGEKGKEREKKRGRLRKRKYAGSREEHLLAGISLVTRVVSFLQVLSKDEGARKAHAEEALLLLLLALFHHFQTEEEYFFSTYFAEAPSHMLCQGELLQSVERCCLVASQARERGVAGVRATNLSKLASSISSRMEEESLLFSFQ